MGMDKSKRRFMLFTACVCCSPEVFCVEKTNISPGLSFSSESLFLTFDLCSGGVDWNILQWCKDNNVRSTLFMTAIWIKNNPKAVAWIKENIALFKIGNHGDRHHAAVLGGRAPYGLKNVTTIKDLESEVNSGAEAVMKEFGVYPRWYRSAGAEYSKLSVDWLEKNQFNVAGFSINADHGATSSKAQILKSLRLAKPGDVLLFHGNRPNSNASSALRDWSLSWGGNRPKFDVLPLIV